MANNVDVGKPHHALFVNDILAHIFTFAASGIPSSRQAPLNVSHTCQAWRRFVLNYGGLWSCLDLDIHISQNAKFDYLGLLRFWLERSHQCPLDLSIKLFYSHFSRGLSMDEVAFADQYTRSTIQVLSSHRHRWRNISILPESGTLPEIFSLTLSDSHILSNLKIGDGEFNLMERVSRPLLGEHANWPKDSRRPYPIYIVELKPTPSFTRLFALEIYFSRDSRDMVHQLFILLINAPNLVKLNVHNGLRN
ncbi:hypothetical protein BDY19DRAFT_928025 [Irpex rosettiformis]|uniref:Uncharacterized protein n=1 Tax=Irpex rosettiformis TaxID=378272 RepID=A0ACB8UCH4_9APHY|nr:hypothetical protein BDY19DRAFT_928025 [Irpex rosettiformis]